MRYYLVRADTDDDEQIEQVMTALNELGVQLDCHIVAGYIGDVWQLDRPAGAIASDIGL